MTKHYLKKLHIYYRFNKKNKNDRLYFKNKKMSTVHDYYDCYYDKNQISTATNESTYSLAMTSV